jgi:hypothetical protein
MRATMVSDMTELPSKHNDMYIDTGDSRFV